MHLPISNSLLAQTEVECIGSRVLARIGTEWVFLEVNWQIYVVERTSDRMIQCRHSVHCNMQCVSSVCAAYTAGTLRMLQCSCSVHCMALQLHSTSVWEGFRSWRSLYITGDNILLDIKYTSITSMSVESINSESCSMLVLSFNNLNITVFLPVLFFVTTRFDMPLITGFSSGL